MPTMPSPTEPFPSASSVRFFGVRPDHVCAVWPAAAKWLGGSFFCETDLDEVRRRIEAKEAQLWIAVKAGRMVMACVTEIAGHSDGMVCNVAGIGGENMPEWIGNLSTIEAWAKANGCRLMRHNNARRGFEKTLPDYRIARVTLEKEL